MRKFGQNGPELVKNEQKNKKDVEPEMGYCPFEHKAWCWALRRAGRASRWGAQAERWALEVGRAGARQARRAGHDAGRAGARRAQALDTRGAGARHGWRHSAQGRTRGPTTLPLCAPGRAGWAMCAHCALDRFLTQYFF